MNAWRVIYIFYTAGERGTVITNSIPLPISDENDNRKVPLYGFTF